MALDSNALIDLATVKQFLNIDSRNVDFDETLELLINAASDKIEKQCSRSFAAQDYVEQVYVNHTKQAALSNFPINRIYKVGFGTRVAFNVSNSGDLRAFVSVERDRVTLRTTTTAGVTSDTTLLFVDYPTVSQMVSAISAIGNYSATLFENGLCTELIKRPGMDCSRLTIYIDIVEDTSFTTLYGFDKNIGVISFSENTRIPAGRVYVAYNGGYSTIPHDLQLICGELVRIMWASIEKDPAISSDSILSEEATKSLAYRSYSDLEDYQQTLIIPYRKVNLGVI